MLSKLYLRIKLKFQVKLNNRCVNIHLVRKRNTKHLYLRIKDIDLVQVSSNNSFTKQDCLDLVIKKQNWILKHLENKRKNLLEDNEFYFLGIKHKNLDKRNLDEFYKSEAKSLIPKIVEKYSKIMNLYPTSIKFRKNKNTWGSCNFKNGLNFNILLVKFPMEVIEYIVIHELAHIKHKNHSKDFWSLVKRYCSDYKSREKLLKSFL